MTDPTLEAVARGVRRALYEWQLEHREPCDQCQWETDTEDLHVMGQAAPLRTVTTTRLTACNRHGGTP